MNLFNHTLFFNDIEMFFLYFSKFTNVHDVFYQILIAFSLYENQWRGATIGV